VFTRFTTSLVKFVSVVEERGHPIANKNPSVMYLTDAGETKIRNLNELV